MVALRKESVDRNFNAVQIIVIVMVALRKESVDRNRLPKKNKPPVGRSLSARRAWIEILLVYLALIRYLSLSARRAWIEITQRRDFKRLGLVALRKESVDRND